METLPFRPDAHRAACLALFDGNVARPGHPQGTFRPGERAEFQRFLDDPPGPYFVLTDDGRVAACGGWAPEEEAGLFSLCWTVVDAGRQGTGLGRALVEGLVEAARRGVVEGRSGAAPARMRLDTIPTTRGFFEAVGFSVVEVDPEGYGRGNPPRVEMSRPL